MGLAHLDDAHTRDQALVSGRELLYATPSAKIEAMLRAELASEPGALREGLLVGDEQAFLVWAVEQLQRMARVPFVLVGELSGEDWDRVSTIELRTPEGRGENFDYDLLGTPCSNVVGRTACIYPAHVADLFPHDELLAQMGVESYVGLPFFDPGGRPLGLAIMLDHQPLSHERMRETLGLLIAFRPRLETVLINRRTRRDLELLSQRLELDEQADALERLAGTFAHAMSVRCAVVWRVHDEQVESLALVVDGAPRPAVTLPIAGTSLAALAPDGELLLRDELGTAWPALAKLVDFEARACLILGLVDPDGRAIGQLALIHERPLNQHISEQPVVRAFRRQFAFELRSQLLERERLANERHMLNLQRAEGLGVLAGGVAHDFNNLLVAVLGNADLALLDWPEDGDPDIRESLVDIRDAARSATQLCQQMLAYAGRATVERRRFELGAELDELSRLLTVSIPRTTELVIEREAEAPWIDGDPVQIRQILMNLITNASDAIGDGDGRIEVHVGRVTIEANTPSDERALAPGRYVRVRVRDDGCGIDESIREQIFDPFFTTKDQGHGLGLAAMLGIVRSHGGAVEFSSELGVGTCFTIHLPEAEAAAVTPVFADRPQPARSSGCVLVVDDEARVRRTAQRMLERAGYRVLTATDGLEALAAYERHGPDIDCVVLDLGMPRLGGTQTLERLRAIAPQVPVIVSSGHSERAVLDALADDSASLMVHKPYTSDQLVGAVAELLARPLERATSAP